MGMRREVIRMAHPFMPLKERKLRKLTREREDSNQAGPDSNCPIEFETPVADPRRKTRPHPSITCQIAVEKISSQL
jgi:hypothetical protein